MTVEPAAQRRLDPQTVALRRRAQGQGRDRARRLGRRHGHHRAHAGHREGRSSTTSSRRHEPAALAVDRAARRCAAVIGFVRRVRPPLRRRPGRLDVQYDLRNAIFERLQRLDFARHDELQTGQLVSRASSDLGLIQGLLSFMPIMLGNLVHARRLARRDARSSRRCSRSSRSCAFPRCSVVALRLRTTLFPATWDAQQRAGEVAGVVDEAVTGVRVVKGVRPGGARARTTSPTSSEALFRSRVRLVRMQARLQSALQAIPALGPGRRARARRVAGDPGRDQRSARSSPSRPTSCSSSRRCGCSRCCSPSASRPGPAPSASSSCSTPTRSSPRSPTPSSSRGLGGDVDFDARHASATSARSRCSRLHAARRAGRDGRARRRLGLGQVDGRACCSPASTTCRTARSRVDGVDVRDVTLDSLRRHIGVVFEDSFLFSDSVRDNIAYGRPDATDAEVEAAARSRGRPRVHHRAARRVRHRRRRARAHAVGRPAPAHRARPGAAHRPDGPGARRRDLVGRHADRGGDPRDAARGHGRPHDDPHRAPPLDAAARRPDRARRRRPGRRRGHPRGAARHAPRCTASCSPGPGEDCDGDPMAASTVAVAASGATGRRATVRRPRRDGVTPDARRHRGDAAVRPDAPRRPSSRPAPGRRRGGIGPPGGGGGGAGNLGGMALGATPELLAARRPRSRRPTPSRRSTSTPRPRPTTAFTLRRFLRPYRRPLGIGLGLVVVDTLAHARRTRCSCAAGSTRA